MFKKLVLFLYCMSSTPMLVAFSPEAYLQKFKTYQQWTQSSLPEQPEPEFLAFIEDKTPLAERLREKWLYQLAQKNLWKTYLEYYHASENASLQCYQLNALYAEGKTEESLLGAKKLWLRDINQPKACEPLFQTFIKNNQFDEHLLSMRFTMALEKRNLPIAIGVLKQLKPSRQNDVQLLYKIQKNPKLITTLTPSDTHGAMYLYGLKLMISRSMSDVIDYWNRPQTKIMLSKAQQSSFLRQLATYKAMRNQPDADAWFQKIDPNDYNDVLIEWQIRYALKNSAWDRVIELIPRLSQNQEPCWQYWLARANDVLNHKEEAQKIYQTLATKRNYYGFLASYRIHQHLNFENERPYTSNAILTPYQPFMSEVQALYDAHKMQQASNLLDDFALELPHAEKSALAYWTASALQWPVKALTMSNHDDLINQLSLRFPLAHQNTIQNHAQHRHIPTEFIYAIIRQESTFRNDVVSMAGAIGLMQLMPKTAQKIAKKEHLGFTNKQQLLIAEKNIDLGVAYLEELAKHFHHHPLLMAAAYNAGPTQVNRWLASATNLPIDVWIETLSWVETRNYLKNIVAFYAVYQYRLNKKPDLTAFLEPIVRQ